MVHEFPTPVGERRTEITDYFISRLNIDAALRAIEVRDATSYAKLIRLRRDEPGFKRMLMTRLGAVAPELLDGTGLRSVRPPADLHNVAPGQFTGDFYFPDLFAEMVVENELHFPPRSTALDFGCSTGRVVRNLAAYYHDRIWFGCDPRPTSIEWAAATFPDVHFFVNQERPPLTGLETGTLLTATFAVSVWSHFSAVRALEWFEEFAAVTRPGGFLIFSSHGKCSVRHFLQKQKMTESVTKPILAALDAGEYAFNPYGNMPGMEGLDTSNWGMAFVPYSWYERRLSKQWILKEYLPGRAMGNQDVYLFVRQGI